MVLTGKEGNHECGTMATRHRHCGMLNNELNILKGYEYERR